MLIHINISRSFCVNQDYVALNMLSQDEAGVRVQQCGCEGGRSRNCLFVFRSVRNSM